MIHKILRKPQAILTLLDLRAMVKKLEADDSTTD